VALFVCYDPKPIAMALVRDNTGAFMPGVHVTHIYNEGNHEARRALTEAINYFALERGAEMVWGTDINQRPKAYERLFRIWKPKRRGIMYCYKPVKNDYNFESSFSS
jgi:hypothetical protein